MKLKNIIILLFFFSICSAFSQKSGKAYYKKIPTSDNIKGLDSLNNLDANSPFKNLAKSMKDLAFVLEFNTSIAHYKEAESMSNDSEKPTILEIAKITSGYTGETYYDLNTNTIRAVKDISGQTFLIDKDFLSFNWILTKEKLTINGISCYKAKITIIEEGRRGVMEKPYVAWYTPDIAISAGPDGFAGLPGLIIQLENEKFVTVLDKLVFAEEPIEIKMPNKGKKMTEKEFNDIMKKMSENRENMCKN